MFAKGINLIWQWTMLCGIGSPCHSFLVIIWYAFTERNTWKNFCWCSGGFLLLQHSFSGWLAEPCSFFWIERLWLTHECCLWVDQATAADLCEVNCWFLDNTDWLCFTKTISKYARILLCPHYLLFSLCLVSGGLEMRFKHLIILIKRRFWKPSKPTWL